MGCHCDCGVCVGCCSASKCSHLFFRRTPDQFSRQRHLCGTRYRIQDFHYAFGYGTVYGLLGFAVSVCCPIATVWYIQHNSIPGDITLVKAMIKFALFLVLGNIINIVGQVTPLLFAAFAPAGKDWYALEKAFLYVDSIFVILSLLPTPVLILIYFKPVGHRVKSILCGVCMKKENVSEKSRTGKTKNNNASNAH